MWINLIVALSNLVFGLPLFKVADKFYESYLLVLTILASTLMHLSEIKHGLPGIQPFNLWSCYFLQFDRIMAVMSGIYVAYQVLVMGIPINWLIGIVGLILGLLSERVNHGQIWFAITHIGWHWAAFYILDMSFQG